MKIKYDDIRIDESVDEYIDGINTVNDLHRDHQVFIFSRTSSVNIDSIIATGTSRECQGQNGWHAYGFGLYTTLKLRDQQNSSMKQSYGNAIMKLWIPGFERCIIPDGCYSDCYSGDLRKAIHGNKSVEEQIDMFVDDKDDANYLKRLWHGRQAFPTDDPKVEQLFAHYSIDGYCIAGNNWCLWKDYKRIIPYEWSIDGGYKWESMATQSTIDAVAKTSEPEFAFGKDFNDIIGDSSTGKVSNIRPDNGYFVAKYKSQGGKANYVNAITKKKLSPVYFDVAFPVDDEGLAQVIYKHHNYILNVENKELYDAEVPPKKLQTNIRREEHGIKLDALANEDISLTENKLLFGNLLTESIEEYTDNVPREEVKYGYNSDKLYYFYRMCEPYQLKSISDYGFNKEYRGTGNDNSDWVGSGTYGCVYPQQVDNSYGSICICYATPKDVVQEHYMCPNDNLAAKFGIKGTWAEQLKRFFPDLWPIWERKGLLKDICRYQGTGTRTIVNLLYKCFDGQHGSSDKYFMSHGVRGFIYFGGHDKESILSMDDSSLIPIAYKDLKKHETQWHPIELTDTLWNKTFNGWDPLILLNGEFEDYGEERGNEDKNRQWITNNYGVENGYMRIQRKKDGKYNFVIPQYGKLELYSPIWFDVANQVDDEGLAQVIYKYHTYILNTNNRELYDAEVSPKKLQTNIRREEHGIKLDDFAAIYK